MRIELLRAVLLAGKRTMIAEIEALELESDLLLSPTGKVSERDAPPEDNAAATEPPTPRKPPAGHQPITQAKKTQPATRQAASAKPGAATLDPDERRQARRERVRADAKRRRLAKTMAKAKERGQTLEQYLEAQKAERIKRMLDARWAPKRNAGPAAESAPNGDRIAAIKERAGGLETADAELIGQMRAETAPKLAIASGLAQVLIRDAFNGRAVPAGTLEKIRAGLVALSEAVAS